MATFYIKEGDTRPSLQAQLLDSNDNPVDLTDSEVNIRITEARGGENVVNSDATIVDEKDGVIRYRLTSDDTDMTGRYRVEFEVTGGLGGVETFPNKGYHTLMVGRNMEK